MIIIVKHLFINKFALKNPERNQKCIDVVGCKVFVPNPYCKICSDHFHQEGIEQKVGSYYLELNLNSIS